jgi:cell division septation protein DedD
MTDNIPENNKQEPQITAAPTKNEQDELANKYFGDSVKKKPKNLNIILLIVAAIIGFIALSWYAYVSSTRPKPIGSLEILRPDNEVKKLAPEDPGGMVIPGMNNSIYENISGDNPSENNKKDNVLPPPEEPIIEKKNSDDIDLMQIHEEPKAVISDKEFKDAIKKTPNKKQEIEQKADNNPITEKNYSLNVAKPKGYYVQIGSFKKASEAEQTWKAIYKKHQKTLGKVGHYIEYKDLGEKGVFFRLQAGPLDTESLARMHCNKLKNCGLACFVTK